MYFTFVKIAFIYNTVIDKSTYGQKVLTNFARVLLDLYYKRVNIIYP